MPVNCIPGLCHSQKAHGSVFPRGIYYGRIPEPRTHSKRLGTLTHGHEYHVVLQQATTTSIPDNHTDHIRRTDRQTLLTDLVLASALHRWSTGALEHWSTGALEHYAVSPVARLNCASRGKASTSYTVPHSPHQHPRGGTGENHYRLGY